MIRSSKILTIVAMTISLCIFMAGCGNSDVKPYKDVENEVTEEEDSEADYIEPTMMPDPTGEPPEAFHPSQQIVNADFSSGIVQIGDEIFQAGGYMTVETFLEQCRGRYRSITEDIYKTDATMLAHYSARADFISNDGWLRFTVTYTNKDLWSYQTCKVGEAVIDNITFSSSNEFTKQNAWFPGGFRADGYGEGVNSLEEYFENSNMKYLESTTESSDFCLEDVFTYTKIGDSKFEVYAHSKDTNLHGADCYFQYEFLCDEVTGELKEIDTSLFMYAEY